MTGQGALMKRLRLGFDMDGVIAEGKYTNLAQLQGKDVYDAYARLDALDPSFHKVWDRLVTSHDVYIITSRSGPEALQSVMDWLQAQAVWPPKGIICGPVGHQSQAAFKCPVVDALELDAYFDDNADVVGWMHRGALVDNPAWPENQLANGFNRVHTWTEIGTYIENLATE